jgi:catechol 2,3-dioxygenase-like lactoylglutathione lyase family enzyme
MGSIRPRMSMVTLGVPDLGRAIDFYQNGLGFPRHGEGDEVAFFELDGTWLGLFPRDELAADAGVDPKGTGFNAFTISHNVHSETEVDEAIDQALDAGAELVKRPQKTSWGGYAGYFRDPAGHLWEVAHNPFTWIGPRDEPSA